MPKSKLLDKQISSGNVFADLGLPDADEHLIKAGLVSKIDRIIRKLQLTQIAAAKRDYKCFLRFVAAPLLRGELAKTLERFAADVGLA
ncbi:MAG: XRE family transcriptional regulator [Acidobacteriota bacterium]